MLLLSVAVVAVASVSRLAEAYPFEVAKAACEDMTPKGPGHQNVSPQSSKVPFSFSQSTKSVSNGGSVEHTILKKEGGPPFAAFMVQARSGTSVTPVGTFQPKTDNGRTIKCTNDNDTGSHNSPDPKDSVTMIWTPPTNFKGQVTFYCTVAETKVKFWVRQKCGTVTVK